MPACTHSYLHDYIIYSGYRETETSVTPTNAAYKTVEADESTTEEFYMNVAKTTVTPCGTPSPTREDFQSSCMYENVTY